EYRQNGRPGIPRHELMAYMREAAEALDLLNQDHGIKHLDVKPRNIFLVGRHVKVADFGMADSLADLSRTRGGASLAGRSALYAARRRAGTVQGQGDAVQRPVQPGGDVPRADNRRPAVQGEELQPARADGVDQAAGPVAAAARGPARGRPGAGQGAARALP